MSKNGDNFDNESEKNKDLKYSQNAKNARYNKESAKREFSPIQLELLSNHFKTEYDFDDAKTNEWINNLSKMNEAEYEATLAVTPGLENVFKAAEFEQFREGFAAMDKEEDSKNTSFKNLKTMQELTKQFPEFKRLSPEKVISILAQGSQLEISAAEKEIREAAGKAETAKSRANFNEIVKKYDLERLNKLVDEYASNINKKAVRQQEGANISSKEYNDLFDKTDSSMKKLELMMNSDSEREKYKDLKRFFGMAHEVIKGNYLSVSDRAIDNATSLSNFALRQFNSVKRSINGTYESVKLLRRQWLVNTRDRAQAADMAIEAKHKDKRHKEFGFSTILDSKRGIHAEKTYKNMNKKIKTYLESDLENINKKRAQFNLGKGVFTEAAKLAREKAAAKLFNELPGIAGVPNEIKTQEERQQAHSKKFHEELYDACQKNDDGKVEALLKENKKIKEINIPNVKDKNFTPLHIASQNGNLKIIKLLVERGADVNVGKNFSPLMDACKAEHKDVVEYLLKNGANANHCSQKTGNTPLHYAADNNNPELVRLLLENGAKELKNKEGKTPSNLLQRHKILGSYEHPKMAENCLKLLKEVRSAVKIQALARGFAVRKKLDTAALELITAKGALPNPNALVGWGAKTRDDTAKQTKRNEWQKNQGPSI